MKTDEIRDTCAYSAQVYYNYLSRMGKGLDKVTIYRIQSRSNGEYLLMLTKKLFDLEQISFEIAEQSYTLYQIPIVDYDEDHNQMVIHPRTEFADVLRNITADQVNIVSDLKFLVKRVQNWYERYGDRVKRPEALPVLHVCEDIPVKDALSEEQTQAVRNILSNSFSYIWGAPGTGKTRFVLASSILSYIMSGKRVAVVAPTNNSLEQSLYGILDVLQQYKVPAETVLRLGIPSKQFALQYPECCETHGLQKRLEELNETKYLYEKSLRGMEFRETLAVLEDEILPDMEQLQQCYTIQQELLEEAEKNDKDIRVKEILYMKLRDEAHRTAERIDALTCSMQHPLFAVQRYFFRKKAYNKQNLQCELKALLSKQNQELVALDNQKTELAEKSAALLQEAHANNDSVDIIMKIRAAAAVSNKLSIVVSKLGPDTCAKIKETLHQLKQQGYDFLDSLPSLHGYDTTEELQSRINEIQWEMDSLAEDATLQRLKNAHVVAVTIDGFLLRFDLNEKGFDDPVKLPFIVDHAFLDEAGYCSLIKGAALLAAHCPVTFLGDHMQLPPVCEMDENLLEQEENKPIFLWAQSVLAIESLLYSSFSKAYEQHFTRTEPYFSALCKTELTATYRFGSALSKILDKNVYQNGFHSADASAEFKVLVLPVHKVVGKKKRENPAEAKAIAEWVQANQPSDFAILSPYINQVKLIGTMLPAEWEAQRIMTVHASQGREWDTVILSVSDTDNKWFTDSKNKNSKGLMLINTAVSRAKQRLIIACDVDYWQHKPKQLICALIETNCEEME